MSMKSFWITNSTAAVCQLVSNIKCLFYLAMHDPAGCNLQMMRNLLIIYEALFNKPNFKRAQTANSIKFINVMFISLHTGQKKKKKAICISFRIDYQRLAAVQNIQSPRWKCKKKNEFSTLPISHLIRCPSAHTLKATSLWSKLCHFITRAIGKWRVLGLGIQYFN